MTRYERKRTEFVYRNFADVSSYITFVASEMYFTFYPRR